MKCAASGCNVSDVVDDSTRARAEAAIDAAYAARIDDMFKIAHMSVAGGTSTATAVDRFISGFRQLEVVRAAVAEAILKSDEPKRETDSDLRFRSKAWRH